MPHTVHLARRDAFIGPNGFWTGQYGTATGLAHPCVQHHACPVCGSEPGQLCCIKPNFFSRGNATTIRYRLATCLARREAAAKKVRAA